MAINPLSTIGGGGTGGSVNPLSTYGAPAQSVGLSDATRQLVDLAHAHGGAVSQAVDELVHPTTSILATIGDGFKTAFNDFVNVLSIPSEAVAGAISSQYSISDAITQHIRPSDVILGKTNPNDSTMQKVGSFLVRTATDVLLDPLTYVTFGAGSGSLFGARAMSEVALADGTSATVNKTGQAVINYFSKVQRQQAGFQSLIELGGEEAMKGLPSALKDTALTGGPGIAKDISALTGMNIAEAYKFTKTDLQTILKQTIDAPLDTDFAKSALSKLLQNNPALGETLIDKGGIKFFGQSLLSGQRIRSVIGLVPGMSKLDEMTSQSRLAVSALFDPAVRKMDSGGYVRLPAEYMEQQRRYADLGEYLKETRVRNIADIIKTNNLSAPEGKFLTAALEAGKLPADARLANAYKQVLGYNDRELQFLRASGISISRLDNHVPHVLVSSGIKVLPFKMPPSVKAGAALEREMKGTIFQTGDQAITKFEQAVLSKNQAVIDDTVKELKNTGFEIFDDNVLSASVNRSIDNVRAGTMKQFVDSLAKNFARPAGEAPGWVPINASAFKNNAGEDLVNGMNSSNLVFHPAVAQHIEHFTKAIYGDGATKDALARYDKLQNLWKASVTSIFPAFHGRNALSNVFLNYNDIGLQSMNPVTHAMTAQIFHADMQLNGLARKALSGVAEDASAAKDEIHDIMTKTVFTDARGNPWSMGELRAVIKQHNIALRDDIVGQVDVARTPEELINAIMPGSLKDALKTKANPLSQDFKPFEYGRKVGNMIEGNARMINFITNLRNTGDVGLAVARTKQFLFDYQYLTPFEKSVMKRIIPFYTFTRKNIEAQVRTLMSAPGRTAAQLTAITNLGDAISGAQLTPAQEAALPDWIKSGINILASKNGSKVSVLASLGTPIEQPFAALQPNQILSSVSPLVRLPVEFASGYDFFQGKPLSEVTNATAYTNAPDAIKKLIGYTDVSFKDKKGQTVNWAVSLHPEMMYLINNLPPTSRVLSALGQMQQQDITTQTKTLQQLIGIKPYSFDLDVEAQKRDKELQTKLESILSSAHVGYQLTRFIPKN